MSVSRFTSLINTVPAPVCPQRPMTLPDGREVPFHWLREKEDKEMRSYLTAENAYGKALLEKAPKKLYQEMKARWKETDSTVPAPQHGYFYYSSETEGEELESYHRVPVAGRPNFAYEYADALLQDPDAVVPNLPEQETLFDLNVISKEEKTEYVSLGDYEVSPNNQLVLCTLDLSDGRELYTIVVRDLTTGKSLCRINSRDESGHRYGGDVAWGSDTVFFYIELDDALRPYRVWRHDITQPESEPDVMVFEERDVTYSIDGLGRTEDEAYVMMDSSAKLTSESWYVSTADATAPWTCFRKREEGVEYSLSHHPNLLMAGGGAHWLVRHNRGASVNFQVDCVPTGAATPSEQGVFADTGLWVPLLAYEASIELSQVVPSRDMLILAVRRNGFASVLVCPDTAPTAPGPRRYADLLPIEIPNAICAPTKPRRRAASVDGAGDAPAAMSIAADVMSIELSDIYDFADPRFRVTVVHPIFPAREIEVTADVSKTSTAFTYALMKQEPIKGGYDASQYASELVWVTATKSTCDPADPKTNMQDPVTGAPLPVRIPVTIWYRRDKFVQGANPLILYGYGSYGASSDPAFTSERLSLLDRGVVYALAAIRGGGEMGRTWRNAGRMEHKMNTFTDFIDCAEAMRTQGWCHPDRLAIRGGSAGGLLVGACLSFRPDLFRAVSALVPFVDVVTTMSDPSIPLTTSEWDEWGNPLTSPEARARMLSYSPMDNLPAASVVMPHLYIESGLGDPRVQYFEPAAWGASLRLRWDASRAQGRAIVHKCNMSAGHGGASGRYQQLEELADEYAFLLLALGVDI